MKLSDALVEVFFGLGVRHVFGVSGANIEHLHDALYRAGRDRIESVLAKTETGAAFMADAQARVHGVLGVCCATSGGGMMNLAVGIAESYQASVPVLAIVGQTPAALDGRGAFQESTGIGRTVDALAMMRAISKFSARIDDAGAFWSTLRDALVACFEGRPGPAVLLVPRDRFDAQVGEMPAWFPRSLEALRSSVEPNVLGVLMLAQELRRAKRPALLVGPFAGESARTGALRRFAEAMQVPVFTTMEAVTAFPQEHRLFAGVVGAAGHPSAHAHIVGEVDRLVVVGSDLGAMVRGPIAQGLERARVAVVHPEPDEALRVVPGALQVRGDVEPVFRRLLDMHSTEPFPSRHMLPPLTRYAARLAPSQDAPNVITHGAAQGTKHAANRHGSHDLLQSEAIAALEAHLPSREHVVLDAGNCAAAALHSMHLGGVASATIALGMGGMGYSIAAAIGTQLIAKPGETTTVILGDGAFLMLGLEVHTAVELSLPILFVVFNNAAHGMCVTRQDLYFEGRHEATRYDRVSIATTARGLGGSDRLWVGRARTHRELSDLLEEYRTRPPMPGVLELELRREEIPPFAPFLGPDAPTVSAHIERVAVPAA